MKKPTRLLLLCFFTLLLAFSLWRLWGIFTAYQKGKDHYNALEHYVSISEDGKLEIEIPGTSKYAQHMVTLEVAKVAAEEMIVVDSIALDAIKTQEMVKALAAIKAGKKVLVVLPENNEIIYKSTRNIEGAKVCTVNTLNVYDILNCDSLVVAQDAVAKIEEVFA